MLGLEIRIKPTFYLWHLGLWALLSLFAIIALDIPILEAILGGLAGAFFHAIALFIHHYGHFYAGKRLGYPLRFAIFWSLLGTDIYPKEEGELPAAIHRMRALGGPLISCLFAIPVGIILLLYAEADKNILWVLVFCFLDAFFVFALGAFTPLKPFLGIETDGDTLLKYWGKT